MLIRLERYQEFSVPICTVSREILTTSTPADVIEVLNSLATHVQIVPISSWGMAMNSTGSFVHLFVRSISPSPTSVSCSFRPFHYAVPRGDGEKRRERTDRVHEPVCVDHPDRPGRFFGSDRAEWAVESSVFGFLVGRRSFPFLSLSLPSEQRGSQMN